MNRETPVRDSIAAASLGAFIGMVLLWAWVLGQMT
jgi:hypothetical protein